MTCYWVPKQRWAFVSFSDLFVYFWAFLFLFVRDTLQIAMMMMMIMMIILIYTSDWPDFSK